MNQEQINEQIFKRLVKLEEAVFGHEETKERPIKVTKKKSKAEDLKVPIKKLFDLDFFKEAKIDMDVFSELQKRLLTKQKPLRSSIVNVLRDMVRKDLLERVDVKHDKKKLIGYINKS
ncbi:MAG: hypothetical protein PHE24_03335 [Patescibacteria group bacterium]|nr:hypothetical protein [Patescibacteria group bacterium]